MKKLSGKPTINVRAVTLKQDLLEGGDFDLVAVGHALIVDPGWPAKVRQGAEADLLPYTPEALATLA